MRRKGSRFLREGRRKKGREGDRGVYIVSFADASRLASQLRAPLSETDNYKEALVAFEEKRKPVFRGR